MHETGTGESQPSSGLRTGGIAGGSTDGADITQDQLQRNHGGAGQGKLFVVGIGPGSREDRTHRAENAIAQSQAVFGYNRYLDLIADLTEGKDVERSGMRQERERCLAALKRAEEGHVVSIVSSGDPGIYGMAGLVIELAGSEGISVPVEIVSGVTASHSMASRLGAPLMLDYACISLSDLLVPWETIEERLRHVAQADLVVALYNPRSKKRIHQLDDAAEIFRQHRPPTTPVGIGTAIGTGEEEVLISDLSNFLDFEIAMRSTVIIGNSSSRVIGKWFVTPRGYRV